MQGLILLNKPKGITSFSAVSSIRRKAGEKKVGHTGTLDPMAEGVLPILLGRATSLSSLLLDAEKRYIAGIKLGIKTDTDDITGEVVEQKEVSVDKTMLKNAIEKFKGEITQTPPMYSALKKDGVRLYTLARNGVTVEIPKRKVTIFDIELLEELNDENCFTIEVFVSKGTYIRSLARDIGDLLGCGATLVSLQRTYASGFDIKDCVKLDNLNEENISNHILNEEKAVEYLPEIKVTKPQAVRFCNGGQLSFERLNLKDAENEQLFRIKHNNLFLGIGIADTKRNQIAIKCIINYPNNE